jgi:hypothetical protein
MPNVVRAKVNLISFFCLGVRNYCDSTIQLQNVKPSRLSIEPSRSLFDECERGKVQVKDFDVDVWARRFDSAYSFYGLDS